MVPSFKRLICKYFGHSYRFYRLQVDLIFCCKRCNILKIQQCPCLECEDLRHAKNLEEYYEKSWQNRPKDSSYLKQVREIPSLEELKEILKKESKSDSQE